MGHADTGQGDRRDAAPVPAAAMTILAIDDHPDNLTVLRAVLAYGLPGATLHTALNGPRGIELALSQDPDVILLDIVMPGMDGYAVCRRLKEDERLSIIPVVFLTALGADRDSRLAALEAGAEGFLAKPIDEVELVAQLRAMAKLKAAASLRRDEHERLAVLVAERTDGLRRANDTTSSLLAELRAENQLREASEQALRRSEALLRGILDNLQDAYVRADAAGIITMASPSAARLYGYDTADELVGLPGAVLYADAAAREEMLLQLRQRNHIEDYVGQARRRDGSAVWVSLNIQILRDDQGNVEAMEGVVRDITERKRADEALRASEAQLRATLESTADGVLAVDNDGHVLQASRRFAELWQIPESLIVRGDDDELLDYVLEQVVDPEAFLAHVQSLYGSHAEDTQALAFKDGRYFERRSVPMTMDATCVGRVWSFRDITDQKRAEVALRGSEALLRGILDNLQDAYVRADAARVITMASPSAARFFGYDSPDEMVGLPIATLYADDGVRQAVAEQLMRHGHIEDYIGQARRKDGSTVWGSVNMQLFRDEQGNVEAMDGVVRDITERRQSEERLRDARWRLESIVEGTHAGTYAWNVQTGETTFNETWASIVGYTQEELAPTGIGTRVALCHPDDLRQSGELLERHFAGELPYYDHECRMRHRDGHWVWVHDRGRLITRTDDGQPLMMFGSHVDITERKTAEEALRASNDLLTNLAHLVPGVIYQYRLRPDGSSAFPYASPGICDIYEVTPDEVREDAAPVFGRLHPDDHGRVGELIWESARTLKTFHCEFRVILPSQGLRWRWSQAQPVRTADGGTLWHGIILDITDRKLAEEAQRENEERYRRLFDSGADAIFVHEGPTNGLPGRFLEVNDVACERLGYTREELLQMTPLDIDAPDTVAGVPAQMATLEAHGHAMWEAAHITKDGRRIPVEVRNRLFHFKGSPVLMSTVRDITERKRAQEEQAKLEAQLQQAQKMESVGRLAGGVAHDFNNMLSVILGHLEFALDQMEPAHPLHDDLASIQDAALRSADLTAQLLAFARKQTVAPQVLDLNDTVTGLLKMIRRLIGEGIELNWQPAADLWPVRMDPSQMDQILTNLCINARDAMAGVGQITIETSNVALDHALFEADPGFTAGEYVRLVLSDTGRGMDEATLSHVFEPFFTTKLQGQGTGLGLATVYGIVKQNGGLIEATSKPGQGARFTIYLPRYTEEAAPLPVRAPAERAVSGQATILLVEDEPGVLRLTVRQLQRHGYTVLSAGTPADALRLANEHAGQIDLLLTDVIMPEMNGRDLAAALLAHCPQLKCLYMSGHTADVINSPGALDDDVHFLAKPFSGWALAAKVAETLRGD